MPDRPAGCKRASSSRPARDNAAGASRTRFGIIGCSAVARLTVQGRQADAHPREKQPPDAHAGGSFSRSRNRALHGRGPSATAALPAQRPVPARRETAWRRTASVDYPEKQKACKALHGCHRRRMPRKRKKKRRYYRMARRRSSSRFSMLKRSFVSSPMTPRCFSS